MDVVNEWHNILCEKRTSSQLDDNKDDNPVDMYVYATLT